MTLPGLPLPGFDPQQLAELLAIVGPKETDSFIDQLDADLMDCASQITTASSASEWLGLRRASHNLVALSGTCGATALQALAERLNAAAHRQDASALPTLAPRIVSDLTALCRHLRDLRDAGGRP